MKDFVKKFLIRQKYEKIFVGFSGGADSVALLFILQELSQELDFQLTAVHFNHGIRGEHSKEDALWCENFCISANIEFILISLDIAKNISSSNLEAYARQARLNAWKKLLKNTNVNSAVALAHHLDDRIEELFIRLSRGANCSGITPLRSVNLIEGIPIIRPLLKFTKEEIINFLRKNSITGWREDNTNRDTRFFRNFFRHIIIPNIYIKQPAAKKGIPHSLDALQTDAEYLENVALAEYKEHVYKNRLPRQWFLNLHPAIQIRILRLWLNNTQNTNIIPPQHKKTPFGIDKNYLIPTHTLFKRLISFISKNENYGYISISKELFILAEKEFLSLYSPKGDTRSHVPLSPFTWNIKEHKTFTWGNFIFSARIFSAEKICKNKDISELFDRGKLTSSFNSEFFTDGSDNNNSVYNDSVYFDYIELGNNLNIRPARPGDKMYPFGSSKEVKIKRFFKERKIPVCERTQYPVVCKQNGEILWVPGVRRSAIDIITKNTKKIVKLSVKKSLTY